MIRYNKILNFITCFFILFCSCKTEYKKDNIIRASLKKDKEFATKELMATLKDTACKHILYNENVIIKNEKIAVSIAEPILFDIYGKNKILKQRPYKIFNIDNYWVISGTMPKEYEKGGTFLIIIDSRNCEVLNITHGK